MLDSATSFGGLVSGLDTKKIIEDLIKIERRPITKLETRKKAYETQLDAFNTLESRLSTLKLRASTLTSIEAFNLFNTSSDNDEVITISTSSQAAPGTHEITVLSLAKSRKISSNSFEDKKEALGLSGEILLNGEALSIQENDSLIDIRNAINSLEAGIVAEVLTISEGDNRLILTAEDTGAEGFSISNSSRDNTLQELGFTGSTKVLRQVESGKAFSYEMSSRTVAVGSLLDLSGTASGSITLNGQSLTIDLSQDSLNTIKDRLNSLNGVTASVEGDIDGSEMKYHIEVEGLDNVEDPDNILEAIGILEGDTSSIAQKLTSETMLTTKISNTPVTADTKFLQINGVSNNETIIISGIDHSGNTVSETYTVQSNETVNDLLERIESAFGDTVDATIQDGYITITDVSTGESNLSVSLSSDNESSPFVMGSFTETVTGRSRELQAGTDARVKIHNLEATRSSNQIEDLITGITLNLASADEDTVVNITVTRDLDTVQQQIQDFIKEYNSVNDYIRSNSQYDQTTGESGVFLGNSTANTVLNRLRSIVSDQFSLSTSNIRRLLDIGVTTSVGGSLSLDTGTLRTKLEESFEDVVNLFIPSDTSTDRDVKVVYQPPDLDDGSYSVRITRAAEKAEFQSLTAINGTINMSGTVAITVDDIAGSVEIEETDTAEDIVDKLNEEFLLEEARTMINNATFQLNPGVSLSEATALSNIVDFAPVFDKDITVTGTTHAGSEVNGTVTISRDDTLRDFFNEVAALYDDEITLSLDDVGKILVEDGEIGPSSLSLEVESQGGFDLGEFSVETEGRISMEAEAVNIDNQIRITHNLYGSERYISVQNGAILGFPTTINTMYGVDVEGTIGGETATGEGNMLKGNDDQEHIAGLVVEVNVSPEELEEQGEYQGIVTFSSGLANEFESILKTFTEFATGMLPQRRDYLNKTISNVDDRIDRLELSVDKARQKLARKFTAMEQALAKLQSMQNRLASSLQAMQTIMGQNNFFG